MSAVAGEQKQTHTHTHHHHRTDGKKNTWHRQQKKETPAPTASNKTHRRCEWMFLLWVRAGGVFVVFLSGPNWPFTHLLPCWGFNCSAPQQQKVPLFCPPKLPGRPMLLGVVGIRYCNDCLELIQLSSCCWHTCSEPGSDTPTIAS